MKLTVAVKSDIGLSRQHQEDSFLVDEELGLFVVADGMGGAVAGDLASRTACQEIHDFVRANKERLDSMSGGHGPDTATTAFALMSEAIASANQSIRKLVEKDETLSGMGTTVVLILSVGEHFYLAHVGDSRAYLMRDGKLHQLTRDHSLVEELKAMGKVQSGDDVKARYRNTITRAVGVFESVEPDTIDLTPLPKDRLLLCSDGVHGVISEEDLKRSLTYPHPDNSAEALIRSANSMGGKDNITALIMMVDEVEPEKAARTQDKLNLLKGVSLFQYLTFDEHIRVASLLDEQRFAAGTHILKDGEQGDRMYLLLEGEVWVMKRGAKVAALQRGDLFGEMALLDKAPRSADVVAFKNSTCLSLDRKKFHSLIRECSPASVKVLWSLARVFAGRLRETTRELGMAQGVYSSSTALSSLKEEDLYEEAFSDTKELAS